MRRAHGSPQALATLLLLALMPACDDAPTGPVTPARSATLEIRAATTGAAFDADDYVLLVDGVEIGRRLGLNDQISMLGKSGQTMELELTDVADNCQVDGPAARTVTLSGGSVTRASFTVHCAALPALEDAALVLAAGPCNVLTPVVFGGGGACDLYTLPLDGGGRHRLTSGAYSDQPAVSPDGSTIAFTRLAFDPLGTDVYAMDADGRNPRRITEDGDSGDPSWSPDGTRIAYVYGFLSSLIFPGSSSELRIRTFDGGNVLVLPTRDGAQAPVWSPDGSRIAYSSGHDIRTMEPDGTGAVRVTAGGYAPVWSPGSDRLAYGVGGSVYVIGLDDEAGTQLLPRDGESKWTPTDWSPDGEWIALTGHRSTEHDVYLLRVDDGTLVRATLDGQSGSAVFVPGASAPPDEAAPPTDTVPLLIHGGVGQQNQNIWIFQGGTDIADGVSGALVTVNGVSIPNVGDGLYPGYYSGQLPDAVPAGRALHLRVSARGLVVEATGSVPEVPVLTVPAPESVFAPGDRITVQWTSATDPGRFGVYVNTNHIVWHQELPGTARELEIPASELPAGQQMVIAVVAFDDGSFSGPFHPDSRMGTMSASGPNAITVVDR